MAKKLELNLFGSLEIRQGGVQVRQLKSIKAQALLCYLAVTDRPHTRSALAGLLWGEMPEANARMNLSQALSTLRRVLGDHLSVTRQTVALKRGSDTWIDVESFESAVAIGDVEALHQGVQLYRGDLMDGIYVRKSAEFETWVLVERARLREMALTALQTLVKYHSAQGEIGWGAAIDYTRHLLRIEPWHEEAHRELMHLLALSGQRSAALMQFERCRQILREELGVEPGEATTTLYTRIRTDDFASPAGLSGRTQYEIDGLESQLLLENKKPGKPDFSMNLPSQPTEFVGRDGELKTLDDLIFREGKRLVTVVGPGGIGKTRLVLAFAEHLVWSQNRDEPIEGISPEKFPDGIFFVSLESLNSRELVLPAVAEALRLRLDRGPSQLLGYLSSKQLLLILDNYEHLLDGVNILSDIQNSAPGITILVTSREPLRLHGEQLFPLKGLEFPTIGAAKSALDYSSGELFLLAARRHQPDFELNDPELKYLARICLLVEGMPLALELAASWVSSLPLSEIAAEIQKNYDFLATEIRNIPARHRSVRAVIDVSWEQLTPTQKRIFAGLSVFRGGFTREACEKITGASFEDLASLVRKSFLRYVKSHDRYYVHELLRQFGAEKLAGYSKELDAIPDRHSQYYCQWSWNQIGSENFLSVGQDYALDVITLEMENVRAAWIWALENQRISRIWNKVSFFGRYYIWRGGYQEGRRTFHTFADLVGDGSESSDARKIYLQASILNWLAFFLYELGNRTKVLELLQRSLILLNSPFLAEIDTRGEKAHNLVITARTAWSRSDEERINLLAEARAFYRESGDLFGLPFALTFSGRLAILSGRLQEAQQFIEESLNIYVDSGNQIGQAIALTGLGNLAFARNDYDRAERLLQQSVDLARQIGSRERIVIALMYQGITYLHSGQFGQAIQIIEQCLVDCIDLAFYHFQATSHFFLGYSYLHLGSYDQSIGCGNEALKLIERTEDDTVKYQSLMLYAAVALVRGSYEEALAAFEQVIRDRDNWRSGKFMFGEDPGQIGLGAALLQLGELDQAGIVYSSLLERALSAHRQDQVLYAIVGFALLKSRMGALEQAYELFSLANRYPLVYNSRWIGDTFGRHIAAATVELSDSRKKELKAQSERHDIWKVAEELLSAGGKNIANGARTSSA